MHKITIFSKCFSKIETGSACSTCTKATAIRWSELKSRRYSCQTFWLQRQVKRLKRLRSQ